MGIFSAQSGSEASWFALHIKPRHEKVTAAILRDKGYENFLPLYKVRRRWSDRVKRLELPLFPGYLFCNLEGARSRVPVVSTPGVIKLVGAGKFPIPVDNDEIEAIRAIVNSGLAVEPCPYLKVGDTVRIEDGPLYGLQGQLIRKKNHDRFVVSISLLRRSVAVELDSHCVGVSRLAS